MGYARRKPVVLQCEGVAHRVVLADDSAVWATPFALPLGGEMKAIDTRYDGYLFRSRLEARWAVFYKSLGIPYQYEPEGFHLTDEATGNNLFYLPDFYLPQQDCWIEIKPSQPDKDAKLKASLLAESTRKQVLIFWGPIPWPRDEAGNREDDGNSAYVWWQTEHGLAGDEYYAWTECPKCGKLGIEFDARAARLGCKCFLDSDKEYNGGSRRLMAAYQAAREERFSSSKVRGGFPVALLNVPHKRIYDGR